VEEDEPRERGEPLAEAAVLRALPHDLEVRHGPADPDEVDRPFADRPEPDGNVPVLGGPRLHQGPETRPASAHVARPSVPHSTRTPSIRTSPSAGSNRIGIPVRILRIACAARTPITESCGPVIPASVIAAVPPGRTRASFVCTCVCVPITAVAS